MKQDLWPRLNDDDWWLDYVEKETDPALTQDMDLLARKSPRAREVLAGLEKSRKLVKDFGDVALPEDGHVYDRLHDRIMAALEKPSEPAEGDPDGDKETAPQRTWTKFVSRALAYRWIRTAQI